MKRHPLILVALLLPVAALAEQGCPDGMYPGGMQPNGPICVPMPGVGGGGQGQVSQWEDRWGAIATDAKNGYMGVAVGQRSRYIAEATALTQCRASGGTECIISATYANECAVMATGKDSYLIKAAPTIAQATALAYSACENSGMECTIPYSACSLSERVR
jgi:hypothetical protein